MMLCAILLALGNTKFDASIHVSRHRITVDGTISITVNISNSGTAPTTNTQGGLPIGNDRHRFSIPRLLPKQTKHISMEFHAPARTVLPIGPLHIRKGDPFGLTRHENDLAERINVYIHPKIVRLPLLHAGIPRDLEGQSSRRIADDDIDFHGLRKYQPGDDIRNVHWPSSAKADSLMIRQYEATCRTDTSLTLSVDESDYASREEFEMAVSIHVSIGVQCLLQYRPLYVHVGKAHTQPHDAMSFLDATSAIAFQQDFTASLVDGTLQHSANASLYVVTVGSKKTLSRITRMARALPQSARCIVLQADIGMTCSIRRCANCTVITIGKLNDLPLMLGVVP